MSSFHSRADDVGVDDAGQRVGEVGQLVVVRGEERLRPRLRDCVARCSATAHAMLRPSKVDVPRPISSRTTRLRDVARVQDVGGLLHLDHERRLAARDVVGRADAREDAVDDRQLRVLRRHERSDLREQRQQRGLPQVGRLAAHVRARSGSTSCVRRRRSSVDVVRARTRRVANRSTTGWRASVGDELVAVVHVRLGVVGDRGGLGERRPARRASRARARCPGSAAPRRPPLRAASRRSPARARGSARRRRAPSPRTPSAPA